MYESADCTGPERSIWDVGLPYPPPPGCEPGYNMEPCKDETYLQITANTKVYTGEFGHSHYPGEYFDQYWNGNLFDFDEGTEWWSSGLQLNPELEGGQGVVIEWLVSGQGDIKCVKVAQSEHHASHKLTLERGPIAERHEGRDYGWTDGAKCELVQEHQYRDHPKARCKPTKVWEGVATGGAKAETAFYATCGTPGLQIFGEILTLEHTTPAGWYGSYATDVQVVSPCHCQALCVQHLKEGCASWKYYSNYGIIHCYLQSNIFGEGEGYYGAPSSIAPGVTDGWTSGTPGRRMTGFETTEVMAGQFFNLTVLGADLPYDVHVHKSGAGRQRVKIVAEDQECKEKVPAEVQGIGCAETTRSIEKLPGVEIEEKVYTICSTKPSDASSTHALFKDIRITPAPTDVTYKVCYCAGNCFHPTSYETLPGKITVPGTTFLWTSEPAALERKLDGSPIAVVLRVQRPMFGSYSKVEDWQMKPIQAFKGCDVEVDKSLVTRGPGEFKEDQTFTVVNPDTVDFDFDLHAEVDTVGKYAICFREDPEDEWQVIPSAAASTRSASGRTPRTSG